MDDGKAKLAGKGILLAESRVPAFLIPPRVLGAGLALIARLTVWRLCLPAGALAEEGGYEE